MLKKKVLDSKEVLLLKKKIDKWRTNKTTKEMPEKLWLQATAIAKTYGASQVSKVLRIAYSGLIKRELEDTGAIKKTPASNGFVQIPSIPEMFSRPIIEVQLSNQDGHSALVRCSDPTVDWERVFSGWLRASGISQDRRPQ